MFLRKLFLWFFFYTRWLCVVFIIYEESLVRKSWNIYIQKQLSRGVIRKGVLKICSKFTGEHPCRSVISIKLQSNFLEIKLRHGFTSGNLLHFFRIPFTKNTSGRLLLHTYLSIQLVLIT